MRRSSVVMDASSEDAAQVTALFSYVASVPEDEKAYHMMYGDCEGIPTTNIERQWVNTIFTDLRGRETALSYDEAGFVVHRMHSKMSYGDFDDEKLIRNVYFKELEDHVRGWLGAEHVKFFRFGIRKRHAQFPTSTGKEYDFAQPTTIAHVDATSASTVEEMTRQFGHDAEEFMARRYQWINVWKPLRGPVNDWPLCLCDASTVQQSSCDTTDMVYPEYFTENISLRHNEQQRWYFLSDHRADEIIIFK